MRSILIGDEIMKFKNWIEARSPYPGNKFILNIGRSADNIHMPDSEDALDDAQRISTNYHKEILSDLDTALEKFKSFIFEIKKEYEKDKRNKLGNIVHLSLSFSGETPVDIAWWNKPISGGNVGQVQFGRFLNDKMKAEIQMPHIDIPRSMDTYKRWLDLIKKQSDEKTIVKR